MKYKSTYGLEGGDSLKSVPLSPPTSSNEKAIMPDRCELCTCGIGKSMQYLDGAWRSITHSMKSIYWVDSSRKKHKICEWCNENLERRKDREAYIKAYLDD